MTLTRIAPTPSGYLHKGNLVNAVTIKLLAEKLEIPIMLRIDDLDTLRCKPQFNQDIFRMMEIFEIPVVRLSYQSQQEYQPGLTRLTKLNPYVCECSRIPDENGCSCKSKNLDYAIGETSIKVDLSEGPVVIWRKDNLPSYHFASVLDDERDGITHIVRGNDLLESSRIQLELAQELGFENFGAINFLHHELVVDIENRKLSKSTLANGPLIYSEALKSDVLQIAARFIEEL